MQTIVNMKQLENGNDPPKGPNIVVLNLTKYARTKDNRITIMSIMTSTAFRIL